MNEQGDEMEEDKPDADGFMEVKATKCKQNIFFILNSKFLILKISFQNKNN